MVSFILQRLLLGASLLAAAQAVTPVSDGDMTGLLNDGGVSLAMKAQPMWFFGQALNQPPCIPTWATQGTSQTPSAGLCAWPNAGSIARSRAFTPKDINGHPYDWERVVVIWAKGSDNNWAQSQLLLSQHSGYDRQNWSGIQNTFDDADAGVARGGTNRRTNLDHPKVYVAWSKHANYEDRNTGWNDVLSQMTNNAFRSQDWWSYTKRENFIRADASTDVGRLIGGLDWGSATSNPAHVHETLCSA
ncbi:hypothetical protein G7046_g2384 [Stylonectria norvegica]|nr:hypothetical protein G7046_g2384 [Stylonectria norvegica]